MMPSEPGTRAPYESLRLNGMVRGALITYGILMTTFILSRHGADEAGSYSPKRLLGYFLTGLGLQALLFLVRALVARYERAHGLEGQLSPLAVYLFELIVDAVTVLTFALATFRGFLQYSEPL